MKKVIYCLGAIALVAGLVGDANGLKSFPAGGQMVDGPRNESRSYNAKTKQTIVTNHNTAISYIERNAPNPSVAEHTPLAYASKRVVEYDVVARCVVERDPNTGVRCRAGSAEGINFLAEQLYTQQRLLTIQQELLRGCVRDVGRITAFCDQVQAFIK